MNINHVQDISNELQAALKLFDIRKNNSEITTSSGRTYKVANISQEEDGSWEVTEAVTRGMFYCDDCGNIPQSSWIQFVHKNENVKLHDKLIHYFKKHPEKVPQEALEKTAKVFLD